MKITWDKAPSASGYHIQYAANSSMTGKKDITINNKDTLSKTVTGLTKGKTYYVRIQTFRKVSGKTYWSSWSKANQNSEMIFLQIKYAAEEQSKKQRRIKMKLRDTVEVWFSELK